MNILVLYDNRSTFTNTVQEHLLAFKHYLPHRVFFGHGVGDAGEVGDLVEFDVVIVHYSLRVAYGWISPDVDAALQGFSGLKILFVQDEYDYTETTRSAIERLGIDVVFTCVPEASVARIYPPERFPGTVFIHNLTGYAPEPPRERPAWRPPRERKVLIGYRGRNLPYWYGDLAQEKRWIGERVRDECERRGLPVDIEWTEDKRIYGEDWVDFLSSSRVTLGTESGSNVFDETGAIRSAVQSYLESHPESTYSEIHDRFLTSHDGPVVMNQISPRIFEAAYHGTGLVLFEGTYSGVIKPDAHFIPLAKDFSNIEEVLAKIQDDTLLEEMVERTYRDIIASGNYSYARFMESVRAVVDREYHRKHGPRSGKEKAGPHIPAKPKPASGPDHPGLLLTQLPYHAKEEPAAVQAPTPRPRNRLWLLLPQSIRNLLRPFVLRMMSSFGLR